MHLLIDAGNSNLKWAWMSGGEMGPSFRASHRTQSLEEIAESHWLNGKTPEAILVSNVAGDGLAARLSAWCSEHWNRAPRFLSSPMMDLGLRNGYDQPERLGIDRWLAMLALFHEHGGPLCVVDLGTAITIDLVDRGGQHLGGSILPGVQTMRDALIQATALQAPEPSENASLLCTNTADAVNSGGVQAAAALMERMLTAAAAKLGGAPLIVLSGQDSPRLAAVLERPCRIERDLVLHGLRLMARLSLPSKEQMR